MHKNKHYHQPLCGFELSLEQVQQTFVSNDDNDVLRVLEMIT